MTYNEFISNIIQSRGQWTATTTYIEQHHILPICLGGCGDFKNNRFKKHSHNANCIWLTAAEHFIAHKLLALENKNNISLVHAYCMMCDCTAAASNKRFYDVTAEDYQLCKELRAQNGLSEETKLKISNSHRGIKLINSMTGQARLGKHYYTNGIENKMFFENEVPDDTWVRVSRAKPKQPKPKKIRPKQTIESKLARSNTMKAKSLRWYTNGIEEIRCQICPENFYPGRSIKLKENNSKKCKARNIHLCGELNGMFGKHHTEESNKKRSIWSSMRHWYNNSIIEVFEIDCPKDFRPGRLKRG